MHADQVGWRSGWRKRRDAIEPCRGLGKYRGGSGLGAYLFIYYGAIRRRACKLFTESESNQTFGEENDGEL